MLVLLICSMVLHRATSNLVLTFPQARFPPLDFLPSEMTASPCGVPKPMKTFYTNFNIGENYNVTWITPSSTNSSYRIRLLDSDGITVEKVPETIDEQSGRSSHQLITLSKPCEQCMLIVEQVTASGKVFKTCADVNVVRKGVLRDEPCNQRGTLFNATMCQCETGYTGDKCQHYAHCSIDDDCLNGGKCVEQPDSLIRNKCFCSYGYFGQRCDQKFNSQNDLCFAYDSLSVAELPRNGMFNPKCYQQHDLSADDQLFSRRVGDEIELIMDFKTTSWLSLGWRPTQLSTSCRLFPILEDTRGRSGEPIDDEMDESSRRHFVAKPIMPKNNGFTDMGLKAPLHAMDCVDMVMASIRNGRIFISDYYSRDRSTPLEDYWYDGEMSLTAAYGIEVDGRTMIMFRRDIREIEPTDHPLGPSDMFVLWAKGDNMFGDDFTYHGTNRGIEQLNLSQTVNITFIDPPSTETTTPLSNDVAAFGVKNHVHEHMVPMSTPSSSSSSDDDEDYSSSTNRIFSLVSLLTLLLLLLVL